jgi:hypothetical protein
VCEEIGGTIQNLKHEFMINWIIIVKKLSKTAPICSFTGGNIVFPGSWLVPAFQGITPQQAGTSCISLPMSFPWQAGARRSLLAKEQPLGKLVKACTCLLRSYSSASRYL